MGDVLNKGETVMWRNRYGKEEPIEAEVIGITFKNKDLDSIEWKVLTDKPREVFLSLDNGHWCYGNQVTAMTENIIIK